jgi:predicted nicotinamide N-methyase
MIVPSVSSMAVKPVATTVRGLSVNRVPLQFNSDGNNSPYAFAVDTSSISQMPSSSNFLATQVWPSARVAAQILSKYGNTVGLDKNDGVATTVCELGCGPGLPSVAAAASYRSTHNINNPLRVIATDIDELALGLVEEAAKEQELDNIISTRVYDLISASWDGSWMDDVDLWIMSDVFESKEIACGAAKLTHRILSRGGRSGPTVWVFAQSDRAQREIFLKELRCLLEEDGSTSEKLDWSSLESHEPSDRLWLCDLDETRVDYGS